jgi:hypothetical protein
MTERDLMHVLLRLQRTHETLRRPLDGWRLNGTPTYLYDTRTVDGLLADLKASIETLCDAIPPRPVVVLDTPPAPASGGEGA